MSKTIEMKYLVFVKKNIDREDLWVLRATSNDEHDIAFEYMDAKSEQGESKVILAQQATMKMELV